MSGAYRQSASVTRVPLQEIAWRRRAARGALALTVFLSLLLFSLCMDEMTALASWLLVPGVWMVTSPRSGGRRSWLVWVVLSGLVVFGLLRLPAFVFVVGLVPARVVGVVALAAGLEMLARLHTDAGRPPWAKVARASVIPAVVWLALSLFGFSWPLRDVVGGLALLPLGCAIILTQDLARHADVVRHSWWLDNGAATEEWASLLVHRDGHAELVSADGDLGRFLSEIEAVDWLQRKGYVWGGRAVQRGLVPAEPPHVLPGRQ